MLPRAWFDLRLERVRLRAMLVLERMSAEPRDSVRGALERDLAAVEARMEAPSPREQRLVRALGLDGDAVDLLWTAVAVGHDPRVLPHAIALAGNEARRGATLSLHALIAGLDGERSRSLALALSPSHPLVRYQLLVTGDELPGVGRALAVPHRVAAYLAGDDDVDAAVAAIGGRLEAAPDLVWSAPQAAARERLARALATGAPSLYVIDGPLGVGRRTLVASIAPTTVIDARLIAPTVPALETALAALLRECLLSATVPVIANIDDLVDPEGGAGVRLRALARALDQHAGGAIVTTNVPGMDLGVQRQLVRITVPTPDTETRRALWVRGLGAAAPGDALDAIALRYRLGAGGIASAARNALELAAAGGEPLDEHDIVAGIRNDIAERLGGLATRIETKQTWDDLVLGGDTADQVSALAARVRLAHQVLERWGFSSKLARGIGVAALFTGPPGTGKTMVAGLIARELDLELYQVDLSKVVSKWVGETEKQLARTFEAAESGHALLLFDEADSLFAKRTEVKQATDRYANLEVNYLLQRIEAFGGITILTTNMDTSIDPALKRRLAAHITFWPPDIDEREALWARMLPPEAPVSDDLDFEALSVDFPDMTGANIRNAVIAAAFLAAAESSAITQGHLERAARGEYRTMGRVLAGR